MLQFGAKQIKRYGERLRRRREIILKCIVKKWVWIGLTGVRILRSIADVCEHGNLTSVSRKGGKMSLTTDDYSLFKE
jgi:hypothetical protein